MSKGNSHKKLNIRAVVLIKIFSWLGLKGLIASSCNAMLGTMLGRQNNTGFSIGGPENRMINIGK